MNNSAITKKTIYFIISREVKPKELNNFSCGNNHLHMENLLKVHKSVIIREMRYLRFNLTKMIFYKSIVIKVNLQIC